MPDLSRRSTAQEWLDTATPSREERALYLESLARFNGVMLGHQPVLSWLNLAKRGAREPLTLMDIGCGRGDLLRVIRRWASRGGIRLRLIGIDIEPDTIAVARAATAPDDAIDYLVADVFNLRPSVRIDLVVSSLFVHHLDDARLPAFLRWMETTARRGWLVADLARHPVPYHAIGLAGRLLRVHPQVIKDGRISVTRALDHADWLAMIAAAGLDRGTVRLRWFLWRYAVSRLKA